MSANPYNKYKKTSVQSASKEKILLMMYEGAIKFIKRAMIAMDKNDIAGRGENIGNAYDIVMELNNTLNHDVGGDIAKNLEQLYMFVCDQLIQANINNDKEKLESSLNLLGTLHTGWKEAIGSLKKNDAQK